jgi:hypothetical protein
LHDAYERFPGVEERSDVLGDVAEATFRRLVDGQVPSLRVLAEEVAGAVAGRHVLMHTRVTTIQRQLVAFGADGSLPPPEEVESMSITVQNLAGNKLDYFLDTDLDITGRRDPGELGELAATIQLTNRAPVGVTTPQYVFGPGPTAFPLDPGVERALVTLYLPLGTTVGDPSGDPTVEPAVSGTEAGRPYVSFTIDVPAGESRSVRVPLVLAPRRPGSYALHLVPSPRVRPTTARVDITTREGVLRGDVQLDRTWVLTVGSDPVAPSAPALR